MSGYAAKGFQVVNQLTLGGKITLGDPSGPSRITSFLKSGSRRPESQCQGDATWQRLV